MPVVVFDIDGTLTDTMAVDVECFEAAIREILGVDVPASWPSMPEITDSAILSASCELAGRSIPDPATEVRIAARVAELLSNELERHPERFEPIPGARRIFGELRSLGWRVAMATGAWRPSAELKLTGARIPFEGVPLSTSSDRATRREIIRHAVGALGPSEDESVTYVGDGVWDGRAATALGCGFVGVGPPGNEHALRGAGASGYVQDFSDPTELVQQLELVAGGA